MKWTPATKRYTPEQTIRKLRDIEQQRTIIVFLLVTIGLDFSPRLYALRHPLPRVGTGGLGQAMAVRCGPIQFRAKAFQYNNHSVKE